MINEEKDMDSKGIYMGAFFKAGVDPATAKSRKTTVCNRRWGLGSSEALLQWLLLQLATRVSSHLILST